MNAKSPYSDNGAPISLKQAGDNVARAEAIVLKQADILRRLKHAGGDTAMAEWTLRTFEQSLVAMQLNLARKQRKAAMREVQSSAP